MSSDYEFNEETVIGHHVAANVREPSELDKQLDELSERLAMKRQERPPMIDIEVGDVDWDEPKQMAIRLNTLRSIVDHFDDGFVSREKYYDVLDQRNEWKNKWHNQHQMLEGYKHTHSVFDDELRELVEEWKDHNGRSTQCANELVELIEE